LGNLPDVHGRDDLLGTLDEQLRPGGLIVLAGLGGVGKTTLALELAQRQGDAGTPVWWVPANDHAVLTTAMSALALRLGARKGELTGSAAIMDLCWRLLDQQAQPWLLCIDNADTPDVLAPRGTSLSAGTGWIRTSRAGTVVVSTRLADRTVWGRRARMHQVAPVDAAAGARILLDLLPAGNGKPDETAAMLSERLGNLPLALYLAGSYLGSELAPETMAELVDSADRGDAVPLLDRAAVHALGITDERGRLGTTWRLSLDALERHGVPYAAALLGVLARFAPNVPVDIAVLRPEALAEHGFAGLDDDLLFAALVGLRRFGLITVVGSGAVVVHPLLAQVVMDSTADSVAAAAATLAAATELDRADPAAWLTLASHTHVLLAHVDRTDVRATELAARAAQLLVQTLVDLNADHEITENLATHAISVLSPGRGVRASVLKIQEGLGVVHSYRGHFAEAEKVLRSTRESMLELLPEDDPQVLGIGRNLALVLWEVGRKDEALTLAKSALDSQSHLARTTGYFEHQNDYALLLFHAEKVTEAEAHFAAAATGLGELLGDEHNLTLIVRHNHARALGTLGRLDEAEQALRAMLTARLRLQGPRNPATLSGQNALGLTLTRLGRFDEAAAVLTETLTIRRAVLGPDHPHTADTARVLQWCRAAAEGVW
jgi:tetratricopeptide (TPR) repeat protein